MPSTLPWVARRVDVWGARIADLPFQVQSGGSFDVDYLVEGPGGKVILQGEKERQGDFVFTAQQAGEYSFCFDNEMSTFAEKFVDFEIAVSCTLEPTTVGGDWLIPLPQVENESRTAQLPSKQGTSPEQTSVLEESIFKISGQLSTISRNQKHFRTRENRNFSTVNSTEKRIVNFSMIQIGLIICMGALQVFVVRFFFQVSRLRSTNTRSLRLLISAAGRTQGLRIKKSLGAWLGHYEALVDKKEGDMVTACIILRGAGPRHWSCDVVANGRDI